MEAEIQGRMVSRGSASCHGDYVVFYDGRCHVELSRTGDYDVRVFCVCFFLFFLGGGVGRLRVRAHGSCLYV